MRADITVVDDAGARSDVRVVGPDSTDWSDLEHSFEAAGFDPRLLEPSPLVKLQDGAVVGQANGSPGLGRTLDVAGGLEAGQRFSLQPGLNTVGRANSCSIQLDDPDVSRSHLDIEVGARGITVRQHLVTNPATLNGQPISGTAGLRPGDRLKVGSTVLRLSGDTAAALGSTHARIVYPEPLAEHRRSAFATWGMVVPAVATAVTSATIGGGKFLLLALVAPALIVIAVMVGRVRSAGGGRTAERSYRAALAVADESLRRASASETADRHRADPDPASAHPPAASARSRSSRVRLGLGELSARLAVVSERTEARHPDLADVPICIDLGGLGVTFTAPREIARGQARWLLCQLAASLPPSDLAVALHLDEDTEQGWRWARWLPHLSHLNIGSEPGGELARWAEAHPGRHLICVLDSRELPSAHRAISVLRVGAESARTARPRDDTGVRQMLSAADAPDLSFDAETISIEFAETWARAIAGRSDAEDTLPKQVHLLDLLGLSAAPSRAEIIRCWTESRREVSIPIGVSATGIVHFDLDRDGPHALIGGTTGSGKSELLRTILYGFAAKYPPSAVQFLLIDYKGGAAFGAGAELPHTAGVLTDLNAAATARALRSLTAELRRRERLLADHSASDVVEYGRLAGRPPLARLVVIIDEFATLIADLPSFVIGLIGIAQRGRSLGMHLVLATQRPGGSISPDIRANANLRIALRTISAAESIDVVDCPDAAKLDSDIPGRAVRAGSNIEMFQVATSSGTRAQNAVTISRLDGWRRPISPEDCLEQTASGRDVVIEAICAAALESETPLCAAPWLPPLPEDIDAASVSCGPLVPLAVVDLPDEQRREVLGLDLDAGSVLVIAGSRRSGRSSALVSAATVAATRRSPAQLHVYAFDFGGGGLAALGDLAHLATMATSNAPISLASALIARLEHELKLPQRGVDKPAVLVLIDDLGALLTAVDGHDLGATTTRLKSLLSKARGSGTTVLLAGDRSVLTGSITAVADERIVLRSADVTDYQLAGIAAVDVPAHLPPGRGVRASDGAELHCVTGPDPATIHGAPSPSALRLRSLPATLPAKARPQRPGFACLGLGGDTVEPLWLDLADSFQLLVAGPSRSGKSTALAQFLSQIDPDDSLVAAAPSSPLAAAAAALNAPLLDNTTNVNLVGERILLIDDPEQFEAAPWAAALSQHPGRD